MNPRPRLEKMVWMLSVSLSLALLGVLILLALQIWPEWRGEPARPPAPGRHLPPHLHAAPESAAPDSALRAVATVRAAGQFTPGKIWLKVLPRGEVVVGVAVLWSGQAVGRLEFDPADGSLLPKGFPPADSPAHVIPPELPTKLPGIFAELKFLEGAEFESRRRAWRVPLAHRGAVVCHVWVSADGATLLPDEETQREMLLYSR